MWLVFGYILASSLCKLFVINLNTYLLINESNCTRNLKHNEWPQICCQLPAGADTSAPPQIHPPLPLPPNVQKTLPPPKNQITPLLQKVRNLLSLRLLRKLWYISLYSNTFKETYFFVDFLRKGFVNFDWFLKSQSIRTLNECLSYRLLEVPRFRIGMFVSF